MSKIRFSMFRSLTQELIDAAEITFDDYLFSYKDSNGIQKNVTKKDSSDDEHIEIPGKGSEWDPENHNLVIRRNCTIKKPTALFDPYNGIANMDSILGIATVVLSRDSSQRTVFSYEGDILNVQSSCTLPLTIQLPANTYRRSVELKTVLYLKKKSPTPNATFYANMEGAVFGELADSQICLEEQSPEFPTRIISLGPREPLWKLEMNWKDPRVDTFSDTVRVIINESYPGYKEIWGPNADERKKNALKIEIYSSAMVAVIEKIRENEEFWNDTVNANLDNLEDGSISDWICYMFNVVIGNYNLDTNEMSLEIRKKLGERS